MSQHLNVLERSGLISRSRNAQLRPSRIQGAAFKDAVAWPEDYRRFWERSFDRLEERVHCDEKDRRGV